MQRRWPSDGSSEPEADHSSGVANVRRGKQRQTRAYASNDVDLRICGPTVAARNDQGGTMKKTIWTGVLTGIAGLTTAAALAAQTPAAPQSNAASADRRMTVTGCLKEAPSSAAASTAAGAADTART